MHIIVKIYMKNENVILNTITRKLYTNKEKEKQRSKFGIQVVLKIIESIIGLVSEIK